MRLRGFRFVTGIQFEVDWITCQLQNWKTEAFDIFCLNDFEHFWICWWHLALDAYCLLEVYDVLKERYTEFQISPEVLGSGGRVSLRKTKLQKKQQRIQNHSRTVTEKMVTNDIKPENKVSMHGLWCGTLETSNSSVFRISGFTK